MHSPNEAVKGERSDSNVQVKSEIPSDAQVQSQSSKSNFMLTSPTEHL